MARGSFQPRKVPRLSSLLCRDQFAETGVQSNLHSSCGGTCLSWFPSEFGKDEKLRVVAVPRVRYDRVRRASAFFVNRRCASRDGFLFTAKSGIQGVTVIDVCDVCMR